VDPGQWNWTPAIGSKGLERPGERAEKRAKKQIADRDAAQIDADNRRRAAEIARQIASDKF